MRFKVGLSREPEHKDSVAAVCWTNSEELLSCGDDHQLLKWNLATFETQLIAQLSENIFPTCMQRLPQSYGFENTADTFVITATNGNIYFCNRFGRLEKTVEAHKGAVLSGKWSYDYSTFLTCGEDGYVKMWSRSGMLRSNIAQNSSCVYGIAWSSDNACIAYCCQEQCFIKPLKSQANTIKWKAHDSVVLCLDWGRNSDLIITGGEDCKYKVWDTHGRPLYISSSHSHPITSLSWNKNGDLFAVGSFNSLRLCDKVGWSHSLDKLAAETILNMCWSPDATQLVAACSNGHVVHAHLIDRRMIWKNLEVTQIKRKFVDVKDIASEVGQEKLETKDRIIQMALGYYHLVVATTKQCYIFSSDNWNTPTINELKECSVSLILLCEHYFLLVDGSTVQVCTYEGQTQCNLKLSNNLQGDPLCEATTAISNETVALRDRVDRTLILLYKTATGKPVGDGKLKHFMEIIEITIEQCIMTMDQHIAFIDKSNSCYIAKINTSGPNYCLQKLGTAVMNIRFNDMTNMLAGLQEDHLIIWGFPAMVFIDREMLPKTIIEKHFENLGKSARLIAYLDNHVSIRKIDATLLPCSIITPFPAALWRYYGSTKWDKAIKLCRHIQEDYLWGILAGMATAAKNLNAAEIAYAALDEVEKVFFINQIQAATDRNLKSALIALFTNSKNEADTTMVRSGFIFEAIMLNIRTFCWKRALDLAEHHQQHIDIVLGYRQKYLQTIGKQETDTNFIKQLAEIEVDWEHIQEEIEAIEQANNVTADSIKI